MIRDEYKYARGGSAHVPESLYIKMKSLFYTFLDIYAFA